MSRIDSFITNVSPFNRPRTIRVYLPDDYDQLENSYQVLYMHDGHNLFFTETSSYGSIWNVHKAMDEFYNKYKFNIIVVGIDCDPHHRLDEYSPWVNETLKLINPDFPLDKYGGEGDLYIDWICNDLIKDINNKYRTNGISYMAGSSMGGFISLYAGLKYPDIFKKVGCFSSSYWFSKKEIIDFINNNYNPNLGIYLDVGTKECNDNLIENQIYVNDTLEVYNTLKKLDIVNLKLIIAEGANHSETSWSQRFPYFLEWLLLK